MKDKEEISISQGVFRIFLAMAINTVIIYCLMYMWKGDDILGKVEVPLVVVSLCGFIGFGAGYIKNRKKRQNMGSDNI